MIITRALTVEQLMEELKTINPKAKVAVSKDSEGNGYGLVGEKDFISTRVYMKDKLGEQDNFYTDKELEREGRYVKDTFANELVSKSELTECVILWPSI